MLPEAGPGFGQGQRAVEVAVRVRRRHHLLGRRRPAQLPGRVPSTGCCAPLLADADTMFVKASTRARSKARRPAAAASPSSSPGRCSRCCSRSSPTSCSRSAASTRRGASALEVLPFVEGWGVELGLLVDVVERFGRDAVAQVDLGVREHRNRPLDELAAAGARDHRDRAAPRRLLQLDGRRRAAAPTSRLRPRRARRSGTSPIRRSPRRGRASDRRSSRCPEYRAGSVEHGARLR